MTAPPIGGNGAGGSDAVARAEAPDLERAAQALKAAQRTEAKLRGWAEPSELAEASSASNGAEQHAAAELELEARTGNGGGAGAEAGEQHAGGELAEHEASPSAPSSSASPSASSPRELTSEHRADLARSGLSDATIARAGLYSEARPEALAYMIGRRQPYEWGAGLVFPFYVPGQPTVHRFKPTHPRPDPDKKKKRNGKAKSIKYEAPHVGRGGALVYLPPRARTEAWLGDAGRPLHWTEGEKKALALDQEGYACVGLTGVNSAHDAPHKDDTGEWRLHPTIRDHVTIAGRAHVIAFDADAAANKNVMRAARRLAAMLLAAGAAAVHFVTPPAAGPHKGIDDYYAAHGAEALGALLATAAPIEPAEFKAADGGGGEPAEADEPLEPTRKRRRIVLTNDDHEVANRIIAELARDPGLYQHGNAIVRVLRDELPDGGSRAYMQRVPRGDLRDRITRFVDLSSMDSRGKFKPKAPSSELVSGVLERGEYPFRRLEGVTTAPVLRRDGSVLVASGYDNATQLLLTPTRSYPPIPDAPDRRDAVRAAHALLEVVRDTPFRGPEHRSAWLAYVLTLVSRPAISGCVPLFAFDASVRGAGKTLAAEAGAIIALGERPALATFSPDPAEQRKQLSTVALFRERLCVYDNIACVLAGGPLNMVLTTGRWSDRKLGANDLIVEPIRTVFAVTANNLVIGPDLDRRIQHCRLEPDSEHPGDRSDWAHPDLHAWLLEHHPRLLGEALALMRAYCRAGKPQPDGGLPPWGSYEDWSALVRGAITWCDLPDPALARDELREFAALGDDVAATVVSEWSKISPCTAGEALAELYPELTGLELKYSTPKDRNPYPALREAIEVLCDGERPNPKTLGRRLAKLRGRWFGDLCLVLGAKSEGVRRWSVGSRPARVASNPVAEGLEP